MRRNNEIQTEITKVYMYLEAYLSEVMILTEKNTSFLNLGKVEEKWC